MRCGQNAPLEPKECPRKVLGGSEGGVICHPRDAAVVGLGGF